MTDYIVVHRRSGYVSVFEIIGSRGLFVPLDVYGDALNGTLSYDEATADWESMRIFRDRGLAMTDADRYLPCPRCSSINIDTRYHDSPMTIHCMTCRFSYVGHDRATARMGWNTTLRSRNAFPTPPEKKEEPSMTDSSIKTQTGGE